MRKRKNNSNPDSREYGTPGGNDTDDYIYLLSVDEADALDKNVLKAGQWYDMANQWWWLRSPGKRQSDAVYILGKAANLMGNGVHYSMGVRPVNRVRYAGSTADL